ncbi:DUF4432 family protein [Microbacterium sp. ASV49]|uniref:DUF4432 family protein n=1 Tax=Microbacterium candidum TaxID=3041922 RepID=A0ABT7MW97_9MICO|nr:DUF4432 family protein [Microbacterium sp. ASV49]MDL9978732.1 DUF4432 family protein [Microbacterium sp. ASV49]
MSGAPSLAELREQGLLAHDTAVATVVERLGLPGSADHVRVLDAAVAGGLRFDVLPARGFDIGRTEFAGLPLGWVSPVADARPLDRPAGNAWIDRFTGGLVATCGLLHIGGEEGGNPLHGDIGHRPASNIRVEPARGRSLARLSADIDAASVFGPSVRLERTITSGLREDGAAFLRIADRAVNTGAVPVPVRILYHVNLGAPAVLPGTRVAVEAGRHVFRQPVAEVPEWSRMPDPTSVITEAVVLHDEPARSHDGWSSCTVSGGRLEVEVSWRADTLPYLHQWILPTRGRWALGIEPSSHPMFGADVAPADDALTPGDDRKFELAVAVRDAA